MNYKTLTFTDLKLNFANLLYHNRFIFIIKKTNIYFTVFVIQSTKDIYLFIIGFLDFYHLPSFLILQVISDLGICENFDFSNLWQMNSKFYISHGIETKTFNRLGITCTPAKLAFLKK